MTGASRLDEDAIGSDSNVLRPLVSRWMPEWIIAFRNASKQSSEESVTGKLHVPAAADLAVIERIEKLREQDTLLLAEVAEWTERCQSIKTTLYRTHEQMNQALLRLMSVGESVPDDPSRQLSTLQESYRNFAMMTALQDEKLSLATNKVSSIQQRRASLLAEMSSVSQNLPQCRQDSDMTGNDTFKQAA